MPTRLVAAVASPSPRASAPALALCRDAFTPARGYALALPAAEAMLAELARADSIVVCAWDHATVPGALLAGLRDAHARGARLGAIGSGVTALAAAGLLDGRRAAAPAAGAAALARDYPDIDVRPDALLVDAGGLLTAPCEGARELLSWMVESDCGALEAASLRAEWAAPAGVQAQAGAAAPAEPGLPALLAHLRAHPAQAWDAASLASLAARAGVPAPQLRQRFIAATGQSPEAWLAAERAALLRRLLKG